MEEKMKSKIEIGKLGNLGEVNGHSADWWIVNKFNQIIEKQNEIIDYLNSQSQPEEKELIKQIKEKYYGGEKETPGEKTFPIDNTGGTMFPVEGEIKPMSKKGWEEFQKEIQDTPEEWEDRIRDLILDISADRLVSSEKVVAIVQSLLDDREREAEKNLLKRFYNVTSKEEFRDVLDKLNSKKK